ncbi:hypothetical protein GCM10010404_59310 [Nonomuraea africana]|uniref:Uncharacterized protein n=1 Tax=Nonomuraea africana TaxID=46171 RepID=A0ABR9KSY9_9ACTN|nr:hypothetical protein [Nonomuraea africana]MBE1565145.1 hypothetical protein [Nonomuraea africana]
MALSPPDVDAIFRSGSRYGWPNGATAEIEVLDIGTVNLPTGRLVARDNDGWIPDPESADETPREGEGA